MISSLKRRLIMLVVFVFAARAVCAYAQQDLKVRVAIIEDAKDITLRVNGSYQLSALDNKRVLHKGKNLSASVSAGKGGILIESRDYKENRILLESAGLGLIEINGRAFKGSVQFIKNASFRFTVVNYIDLEDYIKGVLLYESSYYWPMEALKAQAVACRSYALYQAGENRLKDYDLKRSISSQVYGGSSAERWRLNKAVDATKGEALLYQGKVIPAYFHSTCAGRTEDALELWKIDILPLKGRACKFCKHSPHISWNDSLSFKDIRVKLLKAGYKSGRIKNIEIINRDGSGRIRDLNIISDKGNFRISAKDFRNIIGPDIIRSANFKIENSEETAIFKGFGWGHGVGLCQWGAYFMAKEGRSFEDILRYYYFPSEIGKIN